MLAVGFDTDPSTSEPQHASLPLFATAHVWCCPALMTPWIVDGAHSPLEHRSFVVHALPSPHTVPSASRFGRQCPDASHVSGLSQAVSEELPQVAPAPTAVCTHPVDTLHVSVVHPFRSSQLSEAPATH